MRPVFPVPTVLPAASSQCLREGSLSGQGLLNLTAFQPELVMQSQPPLLVYKVTSPPHSLYPLVLIRKP